jgi:hypothetical protein
LVAVLLLRVDEVDIKVDVLQVVVLVDSKRGLDLGHDKQAVSTMSKERASIRLAVSIKGLGYELIACSRALDSSLFWSSSGLPIRR